MASNMSAPDGLQMPAPQYGGATDAALSTDIDAELSEDNVIRKFQETREDRESTAVQQLLAREQHNQAQFQQKLGSVEQSNQALREQTARLEGMVSTMQTQQNTNSEQARHQQAMAQFALTPEEQNSQEGEAATAIEKMIGAALYQNNAQWEERVKNLESQLSQATGELSQTRSQVQEFDSRIEENQLNAATMVEQNINTAMAMRGLTMSDFLEDADMRELANVKPAGSPYTLFQMFNENSKQGNVDGMMEFVDQVMKQKGLDPMNMAQVPASTGTRTRTNEQAQLYSERDKWLNELKTIEDENSVGNYDRFKGSKKEFLKRRNELMTKLESNPLPE